MSQIKCLQLFAGYRCPIMFLKEKSTLLEVEKSGLPQYHSCDFGAELHTTEHLITECLLLGLPSKWEDLDCLYILINQVSRDSVSSPGSMSTSSKIRDFVYKT